MNMSYCRFQNTAWEFRACLDALYEGTPLSEAEAAAALRLYQMVREMVREFSIEDIRDLEQSEE